MIFTHQVRYDNRMDAVAMEYDRLANSYDRRWRRYIDETVRFAGAALELRGSERVLDVACGTGALGNDLLHRWPQLEVVGADMSSKMLRMATLKMPRNPFVQASADRLPFAESVFDVVTSVNAFHYFRHPLASLAEFRRVLKHDGRLLIMDWCDDYFACKLCSAWLRRTDSAFYRTYGSRTCRILMERAGFAVDEIRLSRIGWIWGLMRLSGRGLPLRA